MYNQKTIIDNYGNVVKKAVILKDDKLLYTELKEGERLVDYCNKDMLKPVWNGTEWTEKATEKEIKEWKDSKKIIKEPTEQEKINAQLLMENAEIKKQLTEQQKVNANMLMQIAKLGGVQ